MTTITEFLFARIAEDEAVASEATPGPWAHNPSKEWFTDPDKLRASRAGIRQSGGEEYVGADNGSTGVAATGPSDDEQSLADASHIARHDPARVLAECAAKRAIVAAITQFMGTTALTRDLAIGLDEAVGRMASVYADHPDFQEGWAV